MVNNQENHASNSSKIKTIKDIYISANIYTNPLTKNPHLSPEEKLHQEMKSDIKNLIFLPGSGYLTGTLFGFTKGSIQGFKKPSIVVAPKMREIFINRVLNSGIETGKRYGGKLGVLGLMYTSLEAGTGIVFIRNGYYLPYDPFSAVIAGFGTGALYKVFCWPRSKGAVSCAGLVGALTAVVAKNVMKTGNIIESHIHFE